MEPRTDSAILQPVTIGALQLKNRIVMAPMTRSREAGDADLFSIGGPFIANPDLVERLRTGAPLAEAPKEYWYGGNENGYSDWPAMPTIAGSCNHRQSLAQGRDRR